MFPFDPSRYDDTPPEGIVDAMDQLHAVQEVARFQLLQAIAAFVRSEGFRIDGVTDALTWITVRLGVSRQDAREHLRVASALVELPHLAEVVSSGQLSWDVTCLAHDADTDRATVVVHAPAEIFAGRDDVSGHLPTGEPVYAATVRRLACDARLQISLYDNNGPVPFIGIGNTSRVTPMWLRRRVLERDHHCRFPGCSSRFGLDVHHLTWGVGRRASGGVPHGSEPRTQPQARPAPPHRHRRHPPLVRHPAPARRDRDAGTLISTIPDDACSAASSRPGHLARMCRDRSQPGETLFVRARRVRHTLPAPDPHADGALPLRRICTRSPAPPHHKHGRRRDDRTMTVNAGATRSPAFQAERSAVDWDAFRVGRVDSSCVRIVRTTCLLESRSSAYGEYLRGVLPDRFAADVTRWADEERHHGHALRRWLSLADPAFDFDNAFERFSQLPYHDGDHRPSRGGAAEELLARCVVEAFASGYYAALGDHTGEPLLKQICGRLKADERRHLDLFASMLSDEQRLPRIRQLRVVACRLVELTDDQIVFAAHCANGIGPYNRRTARADHFRRMLAMHRPRHLAYISNLIAGVVKTRPPVCHHD